MKSVVNLNNSCNESVDASDELLLSAGYEPKADDFYETSVEPYVQLLDSSPLFSNKVSSADPDYDDATLALFTRRLVCQSVVVVNVRQNRATCWR